MSKESIFFEISSIF